jgi:hypothetical protein
MSTVVLLHYNPASPISLPGGPVVGDPNQALHVVIW